MRRASEGRPRAPGVQKTGLKASWVHGSSHQQQNSTSAWSKRDWAAPLVKSPASYPISAAAVPSRAAPCLTGRARAGRAGDCPAPAARDRRRIHLCGSRRTSPRLARSSEAQGGRSRGCALLRVAPASHRNSRHGRRRRNGASEATSPARRRRGTRHIPRRRARRAGLSPRWYSPRYERLLPALG
jgi:hypothetical protein